MRIAVVEDDLQMRERLISYVEEFEREHGCTCKVTPFGDGDEILEGYRACYDLIFLDIQMARVDGMKTAEKIRQMDENVYIVFVTNMAGYAIHGYAVNALDFILKPVSYLTLRPILLRVEKLLNARQARYITLAQDTGLVRLDISELYYVETQGHNLVFYTAAGEYRQRRSMKELVPELAGASFERCNNCYLVNLAHVKKVEKNIVTVGRYELTISRPRQKPFMDALTRYIGGGRMA